MHGNVFRKWVREMAADPKQAFPGKGVMKPEQAEIDGLKKGSGQVAVGARHPEKGRGLHCQGVDVKFGFVAKHREAWPVNLVCEALVSREGGSTLG